MDCPHAACELLVHTIVARLCEHPGECAILFRETRISNAGLRHGIMEFAASLRANGVERGTRVGVCIERSPHAVALVLALWSLGAVYVPLDGALPRERLFAMCTTARIDVILSEAALRHATQSLPALLLILEPPTFAATPVADLGFGTSMPAADDLAYILFTSGSTGTPKGVQITHRNLHTLFAGVLPLLEFPPGFRILGCANFSFDIAFFELFAPMLCGGTLILADANTCRDPVALIHLIEREHVNVVQATPSHWQLLDALPSTAVIDVAIATGEALQRGTASAILRRALTLWNLYGPTECTIWCSAHRVTAADLQDTAPAIISIGSALPGYRLRIAEDTAGSELLIGGNAVSPGYCDEACTVQAFIEHEGQRWYRSGDVCRYDDKALLHYVGRRDSQVKHNGYRIELDEIASLLQQHMSIRAAACLVRAASATAPSLLFACVVFRSGLPNRNKAALNAFLADYLPAWMLPQRYFFLEALPLTANGKLDRAALLALTDAKPGPHASTNLEARIAALVCEVLDIDHVGPCDSFLDLGGNSMLAATLVMTINERLDCKLSLRQVLATPPTVRGIAQMLGPRPSINSSS